MMFANEHDVEEYLNQFSGGSPESLDTPNLLAGALTLARLVNWTNSNSDGWAYWPKPARSAKSLMTLLQSADRFDPQDVSVADLRKALSPVRAFLTRQGVSHDEVIVTDVMQFVITEEF